MALNPSRTASTPIFDTALPETGDACEAVEKLLAKMINLRSLCLRSIKNYIVEMPNRRKLGIKLDLSFNTRLRTMHLPGNILRNTLAGPPVAAGRMPPNLRSLFVEHRDNLRAIDIDLPDILIAYIPLLSLKSVIVDSNLPIWIEMEEGLRAVCGENRVKLDVSNLTKCDEFFIISEVDTE
ncbi:uncharacterized protein MCYG_01288 [Microsporum canis CBS 113480]|uniref:Uncharacterized protein n=1 Tax=Arthroderma otae (strain ATCC MYA-4605 / CBS 113480) TaxID=554155 RepID=C5FES6_ARTOC|nr:uncharacterized protein MCYG_01288 [Microsporum canis CBS 113480]EEQ28400.1 predicted protein [Microsporum canis CBS 113480]